jgi:hypothetical protein
MNSRQRETFNESELVLCRSGYHHNGFSKTRKGILIPTPGQYEQLYLAKKLEEEGIAPFHFKRNLK